jgi:hypothetical protein
MQPDEALITDLAPGYKYDLVIASVIKREIITEKMTAGDRLELLEALGKAVDRRFTSEAMSLIEPADATSLAMVREAWKLDSEDAHPSFELLTSEEVFGNLCALNPSLLAAIRVQRHR